MAADQNRAGIKIFIHCGTYFLSTKVQFPYLLDQSLLNNNIYNNSNLTIDILRISCIISEKTTRNKIIIRLLRLASSNPWIVRNYFVATPITWTRINLQSPFRSGTSKRFWSTCEKTFEPTTIWSMLRFRLQPSKRKPHKGLNRFWIVCSQVPDESWTCSQ